MYVTNAVKLSYKGLALLITVALVLFIMTPRYVAAAELANRSVRLSSSQPLAVANHIFSFTTLTAGTVGSIQFEYCQSPIFSVPCVQPTGLSASSASLTNQSGITGFSIHPSSDANTVVLTKTPGATAALPVSYTLGGIVNPNDISVTSFVRISVYPSDDATGGYSDNGSVAFQVVSGLGTQAYVPPYLTFCAAVSVALGCGNVDGSFIDLGELSSASTRTATTQFSGATNDFTGYTVFLLGTTMTSGNNIVNPMATPQGNATGVAQFGINLRDNSVPNVGQEVIGGGTLVPRPDYDNANLYKFVAGDPIAGSSISTDFDVATVTYVVNVPANQPAGVYTTTVTYMAVASF